jgi:hypothetical protein
MNSKSCHTKLPEWYDQTRLHNDNCTKAIDETQSKLSGKHQLTNWFRPKQTKSDYSCTLGEPGHYQKVYSPNSHFINDGSDLRPQPTNYRNINTLYTRPYLTTPNESPGMNSTNPTINAIESDLIHGYDTFIKKSSDVLSGITIDRFQPLPNFGNPQYYKHVTWDIPRQGFPSRDLVRAINQEQACDNIKTLVYLNNL